MRKLLTWVAGIVGVAALLRRWRRSRAVETAPAPAADPAVELREKLAETRVADTSTADSPEVTVDESVQLEEPASLEQRRARVHEQAQEAIDLMRGSDDADDPDEPGGAA